MDRDFFEVRYDYRANEGSVDRVFLVMAGYLSALENITKVVGDSIDPEITLSYKLEGVEQGSIRSIVKSTSKKIGNTLSISTLTEIIIRSIEDVKEINDEKEVDRVATRIEGDLNKKMHLNKMFDDGCIFNKEVKIDRFRLAESLKKVSDVSKRVVENETLEVKNEGKVILLNTSFKFDKDPNSFYTKKISDFKGIELLLVKKPVFVGDSKWDFKSVDRKRSFSSKIEHHEWLVDFQEKGIHKLSPGDSIIATVSYDIDEVSGDNSIHYSNHRVLEVHDVVKKSSGQGYLDFYDE